MLAVPPVRVAARWISSWHAGSIEAGDRSGRNLLLGILLLAHGYRWGAVLFAVAALIFWAAYILAPGRSGSRSNDQS